MCQGEVPERARRPAARYALCREYLCQDGLTCRIGLHMEGHTVVVEEHDRGQARRTPISPIDQHLGAEQGKGPSVGSGLRQQAKTVGTGPADHVHRHAEGLAEEDGEAAGHQVGSASRPPEDN
jgi:hypothetical protein